MKTTLSLSILTILSWYTMIHHFKPIPCFGMFSGLPGFTYNFPTSQLSAAPWKSWPYHLPDQSASPVSLGRLSLGRGHGTNKHFYASTGMVPEHLTAAFLHENPPTLDPSWWFTMISPLPQVMFPPENVGIYDPAGPKEAPLRCWSSCCSSRHSRRRFLRLRFWGGGPGCQNPPRL